MAEKWEDHARKVKSAADKVNEDAKAIVTLRAAKLIEEAWRSAITAAQTRMSNPVDVGR